MQLCCDGKIKDIEQHIEKIDVNFCDYDKRTPLHLAASEGHVEIVELLLKYGVKLNDDRWGNSPLDEIANKEGENYEKIRELLKNNL